MNSPIINSWLGVVNRFIIMLDHLSARSIKIISTLLGIIVVLIGLLLFYLIYRPVTVWDFSATHTLTDIGVNKPPPKIEWINTSYFGPTGTWWLGDFPIHNLDLLLRLPKGKSFRFRNAYVVLYGHGKVIGGLTIYSGPCLIINTDKHLDNWLRYWKFPKKDHRKLEKFMGDVNRQVNEGHYPEINLYYTLPHGPTVSATLCAGGIAGSMECDTSVSIFWSNVPNAKTIAKELGMPNGRNK